MSWQPLQVGTGGGNIPQLLVKFDVSSSGYTLFLTDLARIWSEKLSKGQIEARAKDLKTTIDPSEDLSQLKIFLQKLVDALTGHKSDAQLSLSPGDGDGLTLQIVYSLPPPLDSLEWRFHLQLLSQDEFGQEFTYPLIVAASIHIFRTNDLVTQLEDKDHIIAKLLDKLEASGTEMGSIFPAAAGVKATKHATQRQRAARHVRGLAPFDK